MIRAPNSSDKNVNSWLVKTAMLCAARAASLRCAQLAALHSAARRRDVVCCGAAGWLLTVIHATTKNPAPLLCAPAAAAGRALPPFPRVATSGRLFRPSTRARKSNPVLPYIRTPARVVALATTPLNVSASESKSQTETHGVSIEII